MVAVRPDVVVPAVPKERPTEFAEAGLQFAALRVENVEDLRPVVNLLPAVPPPVETSASARVALLSHSALPVEIGGPESQVKTPEDSGPSDGARYRIRTCGLRLRRPSLKVWHPMAHSATAWNHWRR